MEDYVYRKFLPTLSIVWATSWKKVSSENMSTAKIWINQQNYNLMWVFAIQGYIIQNPITVQVDREVPDQNAQTFLPIWTIVIGIYTFSHGMGHVGPAVLKWVFRHMWTPKAQISLPILAVWSGPLLSTNRTIGHYRMYQWRANAWMRLCTCVGWIWICAFCACFKIHFY